MPPKTARQREKLLLRQTASNRVALVETLLRARTRVESEILKAAKDKRFATSRRIRYGVYANIQGAYVAANGDLDKWTKGSILRTSKEYHKLAKEDLRLTEDDKKVIAFNKFSDKHLDDYFDRVSPFNADRMAAVNVQLNPQLAKMADADVRALQNAVVDSFREAQVSAMTSQERWALLQGKVLEYADDPATWKFIDKAGRKWKKGNYFNMLNRTVSANIARDAYADTLIDEGRDLVMIIGGLSSNSRAACVAYDGKIVSLTGDTAGFPTLQDYINAGGLGPNCVHSYVYMSDKFKPHAVEIENQQGEGKPEVKKPKAKPVVKMKNADAP